MPKVHCKQSSGASLALAFLALMITLATTLSLPVRAQNSPPPPTPPPSSSTGPTFNTNSAPGSDSSANQSEQSQDQSAATVKVNVEVVQLFFNVKDKHGALIPNLVKDNFDILEDGKQQTIKYFKAESDLPLTLGILIDSSGSQQRVLEMEKEVGANFLSEILRPKDEAFVISFDVDTNLLQDFTNSSRRLREALNSARINAPPSSCGGMPGAGGGPLPCSSNPKGTVLYDTVYLA